MKKQHRCTITNHADEKVTVDITVDFSNANEADMANWAISNRIIAGQRVWRNLSAKEIRDNVDGKTFDAATIGQKIHSREEKVKRYEAMGLPTAAAEVAVDNPEILKQLVEQQQNKAKTKK